MENTTQPIKTNEEDIIEKHDIQEDIYALALQIYKKLNG